MPGDSRLKDRAQSDWVSETCRNIQVQVIKTTAFNNRLALKDSFGMDYSKLFPGSIFNPPSYSENFLLLIIFVGRMTYLPLLIFLLRRFINAF